jgi:hypothetical protein
MRDHGWQPGFDMVRDDEVGESGRKRFGGGMVEMRDGVDVHQA